MSDDPYQGRFFIMMASRVGGLLIALLGLVLLRGGVVTDEPMPLVGSILLIFGLLDALLMPVVLKRMWDRQDR